MALSHRYFIVDFGASLRHTHHFESILAMTRLLDSCKQAHEILLPMGSELEFPNKKIVFKKLLPSSHSIGFEYKTFPTWIPSIYTKFLVSASNRNFVLIQKFLRRVAELLLFKSLLRQIDLRNDGVETRLVFPTVCAGALRFLNYCEKHGKVLKAYIRFTNTSENRGYFTSDDLVANFINESRNFRTVSVRFGYEMSAYKRHIGLPDTSFHSPFPAQEVEQKEQDSQMITVSFLGFPKKIKGSQDIDFIVNQAGLKNKKLKWVVHCKSHEDLWVKRIAKELSVGYLVGKVPTFELRNALSCSNLICLPYDVKDYALNASAIAYQAADYGVPVITLRGSAFADEIERFQIGIVSDSLESLIEQLKALNQESLLRYNSSINAYNVYRLESNKAFLEI
jgi:hypothetical protein